MIGKSGERGRNRTYNLVIKSHLEDDRTRGTKYGHILSGQLLAILFQNSWTDVNPPEMQGLGTNFDPTSDVPL